MTEIVVKKIHQRAFNTETYKKVNSYSHSPSKQQIITAILFVTLLCLHQIFVTPSIFAIQGAILWTIFGLRYVMLLLLICDYIKLTVKDPVDRLIIDPDRRFNHNPFQLRRCSICATTVQCSSHHCMTCNRCTEDFDHHCKYLNNCIGVRNYQYFIRILIVFIVFLILGVIIAVWVIIRNSITPYISQKKKWVIVVYINLASIMAVFIASLLVFHIYISCCANITTLQFIKTPKQQQKPTINVLAIEPPLSAQIFTKSFQFSGKSQKNGGNFANNDNCGNQPMEFYRK